MKTVESSSGDSSNTDAANSVTADDMVLSDTPARTARLSFSVSEAEATAIDEFQTTQRLATRADALRLLIEIALDGMRSTGRRFWDNALGSRST